MIIKVTLIIVNKLPKLSGFVCHYHPAALGSSPKHTIEAFITYSHCTIFVVRKRTKIKQKEAGFGPFLIKDRAEHHTIIILLFKDNFQRMSSKFTLEIFVCL